MPSKPPVKKAPPKKRNLAAKALRDPLFRPKVIDKPNAYKRTRKIAIPDEDQIN
ncbi:MAG: hypothetical protein ABL879_17895 [Devosia sp.]